MIPDNSIATDLIITKQVETSKTYKLYDNKIQGHINGLEALQQAIYKVLNTERYEYPIYSFSYGINIERLIGKDPAYAKSELQREITECLLRDERITDVSDFEFSVEGDEMLCSFKVTSIFGEINANKEVTI